MFLNQQQQAQQEVFEGTNVFTSFAVPPEDDSLPFSYLPVPSMDVLRHELQDRIKVRDKRVLNSSLPLPLRSRTNSLR